MRRTEAQSIEEIVREALRENNLESQMLEHRATMVWADVVGPMINQKTFERRVQNGVLYVNILSAPMRNELMMQRTALMQALNRRLGSDVIKEIKFV